jgi:16S rRNA pseudouridine516 synthase
MTKEKSVRLDRLLSNLGYGSRKEMTMAVKNGWVDVDGQRMTDPGFSVAPEMVREGRVLLDGEKLDPLPPLNIMLNKPAGVTSSHKDPGKVVYDLLPERFARRSPKLSIAGRLDKDSTGLVILTDDGDLLHRITHPRRHAKKHYRVTLRDPLKGNEAEIFARGDMMLGGEDKPLRPAQWTPEGKKAGVMILEEGRNRQIRRMFEKLGNEVVTLHRFQVGTLTLGELAEGEWRGLTEADLEKLTS